MDSFRMLEVWIRTFEDRLYLAQRLKQRCESEFHCTTRILNTKASSPQYSEKFILSLYYALNNSSCDQILILEDDILPTHDAGPAILKFRSLELPILWLSIATQKILDNSHKALEGVYLLSEFNNLYYSGAILVKRSFLKSFVEHFLLNHQEFEYPNFDIQLSLFAKKLFGQIWLAPSYFYTDRSIQSSLDHAASLDPCRILNLIPEDPQALEKLDIRGK
jgi:hypothetical protein